VTVAPGVTIGRHVTWDLAPGAHVDLGPGAALGDRCRLHVAGGTVRIGARAVLGERCVVRAHAGVTIAEDAVLADEAALVDHGPITDDPDRPTRAQGVDARPITVGAGARIGPGAVLGPGATVAPGACVGARTTIWLRRDQVAPPTGATASKASLTPRAARAPAASPRPGPRR
jgi:acetyltransferase-like isoleucine patch superfamily enzyme